MDPADAVENTLGLTKTAVCTPTARTAVSAIPTVVGVPRFPLRVAPGAGAGSLTFLLPTRGPNARDSLPSGHVSFVTLIDRTR